MIGAEAFTRTPTEMLPNTRIFRRFIAAERVKPPCTKSALSASRFALRLEPTIQVPLYRVDGRNAWSDAPSAGPGCDMQRTKLVSAN